MIIFSTKQTIQANIGDTHLIFMGGGGTIKMGIDMA